MKSLLPVIIVVLLLTGAITYALSKRAIPKREENRFGISANKLESGSTDATKATSKNSIITFATPTPTVVVTPTPTPTLKITPTPTKFTDPVLTDLPVTTEKGGEVITKTTSNKKVVTKITKTVVCTPVYGQANTCTEHVVVDTGASDAIFFNFAGLSYLAGLASFIFAKRA